MEGGEGKTEGSYVNVLPAVLKKHPFCPHGPTLLFSRNTKRGDRRYYACAACRDRKLCRFFHWADENYSKNKREMWELECKKFVGEKNHNEMYDPLCRMKNLSKRHVIYCHTCNELTSQKDANKHPVHDITLNVTLHQIMHPTELLKPLECDKREAQYLFAKSAIKTLIKIADMNEIKSIICMGAPRIHEYIKTTDTIMDSMLLDLDKRYHMFYSPEEFCWFNSFNYHFFFGDNSKESFIKFLHHGKGGKIMLILDPPFGGRLEPLAHTIQNIQMLYKQVDPHNEDDLAVVLIYPYFMEKHVKTCLPKLNMIDYKVTYDNHPLFHQGNNAKTRGSPVRIFTDITPEKVVLPEEEGYRFCELCVHWVSPENKHCEFCDQCTSKNGATYVHCHRCQKCVKPTWKHCNKCKRCCLQKHECITFALSLKCYHCGEEGHKKHECKNVKDINCIPIVNIENRNHKRKRETGKTKRKKKRWDVQQ